MAGGPPVIQPRRILESLHDIGIPDTPDIGRIVTFQSQHPAANQRVWFAGFVVERCKPTILNSRRFKNWKIPEEVVTVSTSPFFQLHGIVVFHMFVARHSVHNLDSLCVLSSLWRKALKIKELKISKKIDCCPQCRNLKMPQHFNPTRGALSILRDFVGLKWRKVLRVQGRTRFKKKWNFSINCISEQNSKLQFKTTKKNSKIE